MVSIDPHDIFNPFKTHETPRQFLLTISSSQMMEMKKGLLVDPIPNFPNLHHNYYVADSEENN